MLSRIKHFGRGAILTVRWFVLLAIWLVLSAWIIGPLLWVQVDSMAIFIILGRSLLVSFLLTLGCLCCGIISLVSECPSGARLRFRWSDIIGLLGVLWQQTGILFVFLTMSSSLLFWYWLLVKP